MARYIEAIDAVAPTKIMSSAGGLISTEDACAMPIRTITSGPATGVIAASELAQRHGIARSISFDMGGTSTDVSIVDGGPTFTSLAEIDGLPIRQRRLDIHTVGCGGGSIAWLDAAGALRVGPKSVGADPGPAFWGIGSELSVSDANFVLGRLRLESLAGNAARQVRPERSLQAAVKLADALGLAVENSCERVVEAAEAGMCAAIRKVSSKRGFDPADFVLTAFGGSGGIHACAVANALGIATVLIPQSAGVFSAVGLLRASEAWEESLSVIGRDADWQKTYELLEADARRHVPVAGAVAVRTADMRYKGQSHEIEILATGNLDDAKAAFRRVHLESFGVVFDQRAIEWVTARVRVETAMPSIEQTVGPPTETTVNDGEVFWQGSRIACRIFAGTPNEAAGAALILLEGSTIFLPPDWRSMRLADGALRLSRR
jgi:N-methylhydantoinase A